MNSNDTKIAVEQIEKFNLIAGNLTPINHEQTLDGMLAQSEYNLEEAQELYDGIIDQDAIAMLDGACDSFVTACGALQRLSAAGFNVEKALARVCENNLSKFPTVFEHENHPENQPPNTTVHVSAYGHVAYKRNVDGKVMKPLNYKDVDLTSCVVDGFFNDSTEQGE